ncbi:MAG: insulinase family protein [Deltaproteobacteria bacterium]|nr:insulinase family protein [Deltaproteobacteria bacterium]
MVSGFVSSGVAQGGIDQSYSLPNGLKAVFFPLPGNPVVSVSIMVKVGSSSEDGTSEYGLAHLMEHMAFKGTKKRGLGEVSGLVENNGGSINAYTSVDSTVYYLSLPAERLELALDVLSDITFNPIYDPEEYALEKEVVIEEIKKSSDTPDHILWETFMKQTFPEGHSYHHPILGSEQTVREAGRHLALAFHDRYYRPNNAVVIVTGGFDLEEARALVDKYFGELENPEAAPSVTPAASVPVRQGPVIEIIENRLVTVPKVLVGFRCASGGSPQAPSLHLLSEILSQGRSGRLTENVKSKKGLVTDVGTFPYTAVRDGVFVLQLETEVEKIIPALEAVFFELKSLTDNPPSGEEMTRARIQATKSFIDRQESAESLASLLASFELYSGDYRLKDAYISWWSRITSLDLVRLAKQLFSPENMTVVVMLPAAGPKPDEAALKDLAANLKLELAESVLGAASVFEEHTLKNGIRVLVMRDPSLPLVDVRLSFMGGVLAESEGCEGLSTLVSMVWSKATESMNSEIFARKVEDLGASIESQSGRNSISLYGSFMTSNWLEGLDLLTDVLTKPAFAEDNLQEARQELLASLRLQEEHLPLRLLKMVRLSLFKDHPYRNDVLGTSQTVAGFTRDDLVAFYGNQIRPENMVLAVAGDIEPAAVLETLDRRLADWNPSGTAVPTVVPEPPLPPDSPLGTFETVETAQTHLCLVFLGPGMGHRDQAALEVLEAHLSGLGGILFRELRDKRSLAYSVSGRYGPGLKVGSFTFYIASDSQKTSEALTGMLEIIGQVKDQQLTAEELEGAIRFVTGSRKIHHQTLSSRSDEAIFSELYGLGSDFDRRYLKALEAATAEDIQRAARQYLDPGKVILGALGNAQSVEAANAVVRELTK